MNPAISNMMTMGAPNSTNTSTNVQDQEKKERLELLTYVKAHFDLIAVTLLVGYLAFALYNETKKQK
jgi:hypothetical protein